MTLAEVAALITALGGGAIIPLIGQAIRRHYTGRAGRERSRIDELVRARACAERDRDHQAKWRRILQEYASQLRSILIERGVPASDLPPVPSEPRRDHEREHR